MVTRKKKTLEATPTFTLEQLDDIVVKAKKRGKGKIILSFILTLIGIGMMVYPVVATFQTNQHLTDQINNYQNVISKLPQEVNDASLVQAREYNENLTQHPFTPPPIGSEESDEGFRHYKTMLSDTPEDPMAQIVMPSIDVNLPVYHGTTSKTLSNGAGHLYGTHLPVGASHEGQTVATAISAHTGMINASMFDNLKNLKPGDSAFIRTRGITLHYVMRSSKVVEPTDVGAIHTEPGKDILQLITCTPYNVNTKRLVVTLDRAPLPTPMPDLDSAQNPYGPAGWQWWMTATSIVAILFFLVFLNSIWNSRRHVKRVVAAAEKKREEISTDV